MDLPFFHEQKSKTPSQGENVQHLSLKWGSNNPPKRFQLGEKIFFYIEEGFMKSSKGHKPSFQAFQS